MNISNETSETLVRSHKEVHPSFIKGPFTERTRSVWTFCDYWTTVILMKWYVRVSSLIRSVRACSHEPLASASAMSLMIDEDQRQYPHQQAKGIKERQTQSQVPAPGVNWPEIQTWGIARQLHCIWLTTMQSTWKELFRWKWYSVLTELLRSAHM